jgi:hypothetical protein
LGYIRLKRKAALKKSVFYSKREEEWNEKNFSFFFLNKYLKKKKFEQIWMKHKKRGHIVYYSYYLLLFFCSLLSVYLFFNFVFDDRMSRPSSICLVIWTFSLILFFLVSHFETLFIIRSKKSRKYFFLLPFEHLSRDDWPFLGLY